MPRSPTRDLVPLSKPKRRRWRASEASSVLERLGASGPSVRAFAARENLGPERLYRWRAQLRGAGTRRPTFVEVKAAPAATTIEVVLRLGHVVRLQDGFPEEALRRLVAILDAPAGPC